MGNKAQSAEELNWNIPPIGRPKVITDEYISSLRKLVQHRPQQYGYPFKRWTAAWLRCHLAKELGIEVSDRHINRLLAQMGLSTRPIEASAMQGSSDRSNVTRQILIQDLNPSTVPKFNWPFIERRRG